MRKCFKVSLVILILLLFFVSCKKQHELKEISNTSFKYDEPSSLKREFGLALLAGLTESKLLRTIIKEEAIKMFNGDYDVLFYTIADLKIENNKSVYDFLSGKFNSEKRLAQILEAFPTLTIFVPSLPENTFSAQRWNITTEIPAVAIRTNNSNEIPLIDNTGKEVVLKTDKVPAFPVVVIKENERLISNKDNDLFDRYKTRIVYNKRSVKIRFWDNEFDCIKNDGAALRKAYTMDSKIVDAYNIYNTADGWQRDYIYYDIQPASTSGSFKYDFQEHITDFKMLGDGKAALNLIADQTGDPKSQAGTGGYTLIPWTDGFFEFKIKLSVSSSNPVTSEVVKGVSVHPSLLFDVPYLFIAEPWRGGPMWLRDERKPILLRTTNISIPLINWDLSMYSSTMKISFEEVDLTTTTINTTSRTDKFAINFEISSGSLLKAGLKFGLGGESSKIRTIQTSFTQGNDVLGDAIINFGDKVIISTGTDLSGNYFNTRSYSTGWCEFSVEPKRVQ